METYPAFGNRTWNLDCLIMGRPTLQQILDGRLQLLNFLGMDMAGMQPAIYHFPIPDGRGGHGLTLCQPFVEPMLFQPVTTSFVIFDLWPRHFTLTLKSCLRFCEEPVVLQISRLFGEIKAHKYWVLEADDGRKY